MTSSNNPIINTNTNSTNFSFNNPVKLDRANYLIWRSQVLASIRGNRLEGFINGTKSEPEQYLTRRTADGSTQVIENPEFITWKSQDQTLLGWLLSSISEGTLGLVITLDSSYAVWKTLEKKFGVQSEAKVLQIKYEINTLKKDSMNVEDYCMKMKALADKLACAGSPLNDRELLMHILNGLGSGFIDIASFITACKMDFDDAYALLLTHESRIEQQEQDAKTVFNANLAQGMFNANFAQTRGNYRRGGYTGGFQGNYFGGRGSGTVRGFPSRDFSGFNGFNGEYSGFSGYGRGQNMYQMKGKPIFNGMSPTMPSNFSGNTHQNAASMSEEMIICQICSKPGHSADVCWYRFNEDFVPASSRANNKGKIPKSAYITNLESANYVPSYMPNFDEYSAGMSPVYMPSFHASYSPRAAYMANCEGPADEGWYLDSGATHHLTNNMANMHIREEFKGNDQLIIGNGQGLPITHVGNASLRFGHTATCILLKDMLFVPSITKNLLSISKLTSDNNISVEFCGNVCFVKDKMKGQVLLQGLAEKGLYKLQIKPSSPSSPNTQTHESYISEESFSAGTSSNRTESLSGSDHTISVQQNQQLDLLDSSGYTQTPTTNTSPASAQTLQPEPQIPILPHDILTNTHSQNQQTIHHPTHKMITGAKSGIFKPKVFYAALSNREPDTVEEALEDQRWCQAMKDEYDALMKNNTWILVPNTSEQKVVDNKWVFRVKYNTDGSVAKHKARLVAKGFQQVAGVDYFKTFSPVVKPATVRVVLSLAAMNGWKIRQVDINNAFLNGDLVEDVFMKQPEGFINVHKPGHICKLNKALYGLKQAPRAWFDKLKETLIKWGFQNSRADTSLFLKKEKGSMIMILIYVDDILITGPNSKVLEDFISYFSSVFALKDLGSLSYFLGIEVSYYNGSIFLSQRKYIRDLLKKTELLSCKGCDTPMTTGTKLQKQVDGSLGQFIDDPSAYRSLVGGLQYVILTRPEIAFAVHKLSQYVAMPTLQHLMACKRVLRYLKETQDYGPKFGVEGELTLTGYTDADWACDIDDRKSVGAYCIYLGNNLISWSSKKQSVVTRSSAESEYRSLAAACAEITWLQSLFSEMNLQCTSTPMIWCDNKSATELAKNPVYHSRTKHIELDMHFIRDKVVAKELQINYIPSEEQIADVLTKPLTFNHFNFFRSKLNVQPCPLSLKGAIKEAHLSFLVKDQSMQRVIKEAKSAE
ncbi:retrovirus-related pol polyprotein from transposon RE1 [Citrus sinensis]|nr:retrovirus-related pol polyprotein from transposon RE1 [Citrus sinensis]